MRNMVFPASIDNDLTMRTMEYVFKKYKIHIDPNTAVAFAAAQLIVGENKWNGSHTVVLATGHPAREANLAGEAAGKSIDVPEAISALKKRCDPIAIIPPQLDAFENAIASCF